MKRYLLASFALCSLAANSALAEDAAGTSTDTATEASVAASSVATPKEAEESAKTGNTKAPIDLGVGANPQATDPSGGSVEPSPYGPSDAEINQTHGHSHPGRHVEPKDDKAPVTLLDGNMDYAFGGFGGISVKHTFIAQKSSAMVCGEGAVIIDHALSLGGGGCGVLRKLRAEDYQPKFYESEDRMMFGYGGAIVRYHMRTRKLVNVSVGALVGAGGVSTGHFHSNPEEDGADEFDQEHSDAVFVFEPQVGAHMNITRWLRVGAIAGFRLVSNVNTKGLRDSDLFGPTLGGQIQAGWF